MTARILDFTKIKPFITDFKGRLGESATINRNNNTFLWVDIIKGEIHRVFLKGNKLNRSYENHEIFIIPNESIGVIHLTSNDDIVLLGANFGIAEFKFSTNSFKYLWKFDKLPEILQGQDYKLRSNDGNIDPNGNIWQGLMGDFQYGQHDQGKLVKIDTKTNQITVEIEKVFCPNGINWSQNGETLYWASSKEGIIYKIPFDLINSTIGTKEPYIILNDWYPGEGDIIPDGHALTENNHIFSALWGHGSLAHFDETGTLVEKYKIPGINITDVIFGDEDEIFITTANALPEDEKLIDGTLGGSIFRIVLEGGHKGIDRPVLKYPLIN
ncbi:hypothetical protein WICMUC_001074 [Wickerhamomyces mucosus]|uniref:SMP-30/Gluconolactonase/LRE-like region domain-containing protein n=1 Tax=Wickerhamomyces mucosus TaxID=1378264 RepID=A0A9P8PY23_9ASCO|nr:hypothetical protein WICMUC_001074 [Wickerhamomyces mucosus]